MSQAVLTEKPTLAPKSQEAAAIHYSLGYMPALDGLRAVSIMLVIFAHEIGPLSSQWGHAYNGWIGVDVFFVISGFLITSILLKESQKTSGDALSGSFSLGKFYLRRWLRICPAYYFYLAVVAAWYIWGGDHHLKPFVCAAFYLTNLDIAYGWNLIPMKPFLTHLWSLGLEEQFYLFMPTCMKLFKKHALTLVASIIAAVYVWRLYLIAHGAAWYRIINGFDTKIDVLMAGVLTALLLARPGFRKFAEKWLSNGFVQCFLVFCTLQSFQWLTPPFNAGMDAQLFFWGTKMPLCTFLISATLVSVLSGPGAIVSRVLSNPAAVFVGKLSYSLYLWHPLVHILYCAFFWDFCSKNAVRAELYQYGLIFACAGLSYYLIEQPFLKLKSRFS